MKLFAMNQKTAIKALGQIAIHKFSVWIKQHKIHHCGNKLLISFKILFFKPAPLLICTDPHEQVIAQSKSFFHGKSYKGLIVCFCIVVYENFMDFHPVCLTTSTEVGLLKLDTEIFERNKESAIILIHMIELFIKLRCPLR